MCNCEIFQNRIKLSILLVCIYLELGDCSLKFLRQLGQRQRPVFHGQNVNFIAGSNPSPCPNIFEYRYDDAGRLFGFVEVASPSTSTIELEVDFCVGNPVNQGAEGSITLPYFSDQQIIDNIQQGRPLNYRINFPAWRNYQPKITKISVNGNTICIGQPYALNVVPILTTINLRHKLQINQIPQQSTNRENNQNVLQKNTYGFNNRNDVVRPSPNFDVRNDNSGSVPGNPYNFKPNFPKTIPEIIFQPESDPSNGDAYARNPFLNNLSTERPDEINRREDFNGQSFGISTTERSFTLNPVQSIQNSNSINQQNSRQSFNDICGRPAVTNSLVLHGHDVPKGAFPWLVAMFVKTNRGGLEYQCTGTLISRKHVVTAGHCVKPDAYVIQPEKIVLVMGRMNIQGWEATDGDRILGADQVFIHPNFTPSTADADISVIIMKADVEFNTIIRPICLWNEDSDLRLVVGRRGTVVGWGRDENGLKVSPEPKQIELPIVSQEQCLRSNYTFTDITSERTFCAGDRSGSGPCNGDSGSGFVLLINGRWYLRGIVSMSLSDPYTRTCDLYNYVVFTDVSKFSKWLLDLIK